MKREEIAKILSASGDPARAIARLRSIEKRNNRNAARKIGVSAAALRKKKFKLAVEKTFAMLQISTVPRNR
jgi:hypothetical protein